MKPYEPLTAQQQRLCEGSLNLARWLAVRECDRSGVPQDAEEAQSAALEALVQAACVFEPLRELSFNTLVGVVVWRALAARRDRQRRESAASLDAMRDDHDFEPPAPPQRPAGHAADQLRDFLGLAGPQDGEIVRLRGVEGRSWQQIGRELGISAHAAKKRYGRAVDRLRRLAE